VKKIKNFFTLSWPFPHTTSLLLVAEFITGIISLTYDLKSLALFPMIFWLIAIFCWWEFERLKKNLTKINE